jgi:hypothetical protein
MRRIISRFLALLLLASPFPLLADSVITDTTEASLRTAVAAGGLVDLQLRAAQILLTQPIVVQVNTTLSSTGSVVISGNNVTRLFVVNPGVSLTVTNIGLFSGSHTSTNLNDGGIADTAGAGIYNKGGTVTLLNSTISSHTVFGTPGANGTDDNTGSDGESGGDAPGGAIFNKQGMLVVSNCTFAANTATGGSAGSGGNGIRGLISNGGNGGNGGAGGGAAIYSQGGTLLIYNSTFTNNIANGGSGGAAGTGSGIGFNGQNGGAGAALGGAIATDAAYVVSSGNTFIANSANGATGLVGNTGQSSNRGDRGMNGGQGIGGAIYNRGVLLMTNCTLAGNAALGGAAGAGGTGSSSGFGTQGGNGGDGGNGIGGAIENTYQVTLIQCTFSANRAVGGAGGGAGAGAGIAGSGDDGKPGTASGGALSNDGVDITLANTILANSDGGNVQGKLTDLGGNISSDTTALFTYAYSKNNTDPKLQALGDNGGLTWTVALSSNSPAIDYGVYYYATPTDQRGTNRVGGPDAGAFEFTGLSSTNSTDTNSPPIPTNTVMSITRASTNAVQLRWEANTNFVVQSNSSLIPTNWVTLTNLTISTQRGNYIATMNVSTGRAANFFRIKSK